MTIPKTDRFKTKKGLVLNKRTIAHLNRNQMAYAGGGGLPPQTKAGETCTCPTEETLCACTFDTTGDTGITPATSDSGFC